LAVWYRRLRSFSRAVITIQSSSPRTSRESTAGSTPRTAAMPGNPSAELSRALGRGVSSSRITRRTSSSATWFTRRWVSGVVPVSSS
jgi:hypothetical protein